MFKIPKVNKGQQEDAKNVLVVIILIGILSSVLVSIAFFPVISLSILTVVGI